MLEPLKQYVAQHRTQLAKFLTVGLITFGINFFSFHFFFGVMGWDYRIAVSLAYVITVTSHFWLNRFFTFSASEQRILHNVGKYLLLLPLNYGVTLAVVGLVVEVAGLSPYLGVITSTLATSSVSFLILKHFVFKSGASWQSS